jgi:pimeloyl-ACP methyl ester carboxylesterase
MKRRVFSARDGLSLSALEWEGPETALPVLCLPGFSRNALDFADLGARHAGRRRVVALDYIGHGESARAPVARYRLETAITDVLDALAALRLGRAIVVGTSMGGLLGMALAVLRPGALAGLVLNDSGPRLDAGGLTGARDMIGSDPGYPSLEAAGTAMRQWLPETGIPADGWEAAAACSYRQGEDGRWHARWDTGLLRALPPPGTGPTEVWGLYEALAATPTLLIWGQESKVLSAATVLEMRRRKPDLELLSLPGLEHAPWLGLPAAVARIDAFIDRLG